MLSRISKSTLHVCFKTRRNLIYTPIIQTSKCWKRTKRIKRTKLEREAINKFKATFDLQKRQHFFTIAEQHRKEGKLDEAIAAYEKALETDENNFEINKLLAQTLTQAGQLEKGIQHYLKCIELTSDEDMRGLFHFNIGVSYHKLGKLKTCKRHYKKAVQYVKDYVDAYIQLALIYFQQKKWKSALKYHLSAIQLLEKDVEPNQPIPLEFMYNSIAQIYEKQNKIEEAMKYLKKAVEKNKDHYQSHGRLAALYSRKENYEKAKYHFEEVLRINPPTNKDIAHHGIALAFMAEEKYANAEYHLQEAIKINPKMKEAFVNLGILYAGQEKYEKAQPQFEKALEVDPEYHIAKLHLGGSLLKQSKVDEAIKVFLELSSEYHGYLVSFLTEQGNYFAQEREFDNAIQCYKAALNFAQGDKERTLLIKVQLGSALMMQNKFEEALKELNEVTDQDMKSYSALTAIADIAESVLQRGHVDDAIRICKHALESNPEFKGRTYLRILDALGAALVLKGEHDEAIKYYKQALQGDPSKEIYANLGNAYFRKGDYQKAYDVLQKSLQLDPNFAVSHCLMGNTLLKMGKYEEAMEHFYQTLKCDSTYEQALVHMGLGAALLNKNEIEEGLKHMEIAAQLEPETYKPIYEKVKNDLGK